MGSVAMSQTANQPANAREAREARHDPRVIRSRTSAAAVRGKVWLGYARSIRESTNCRRQLEAAFAPSRSPPFPGKSPGTIGSRCRASIQPTVRSTRSGCCIVRRARPLNSLARATSSADVDHRSRTPHFGLVPRLWRFVTRRWRGSVRSVGCRRSPVASAT